VFAGYACGVYVAFLALALVTLAQSGMPPAVFLVWVPVGIIAFRAEAFIHGTPDDRAAVRDALASGALRRHEPLLAGFLAGAVAICLCYGVFRTKGLWTGSLAILLVGVLLVLLIAPAAAAGWLVARARELGQDPRGFPVIPAPPGSSGTTTQKDGDR
jgi:hypothetical protein